MNPVIQIIVDTLVKNLEPLFVTKTVSQLMFEGYEDELLNITAALNVSEFRVPLDKFGWYYPVCMKHCVRILVLWVMAPFSLMGVHQHFRGPCHLHLQDILLPPTRLHGVITQKTRIHIFTTLKTSNLT
jgi:hypothetical protein